MARTKPHIVMLNDLLPPLNSVIYNNGNPVDLADYTLKFRLLDSANTVVLDDVTAGVTAHPTQNFTADADTDLLTCEAHGVQENDQVVLATSASDLPAPLAVSTRYFARDVTPNAFKLTTVPGGAAVDITDAGSGTHTFYVVGSAQMDFSATEVDTAGSFKGYWRVYSGSEISTFPKGEQSYIPVEVVALG